PPAEGTHPVAVDEGAVLLDRAAPSICILLLFVSSRGCFRIYSAPGHGGGHGGDTGVMSNDITQDQAIYQALKAADEVGAALQAHLVEEHGADLDADIPHHAATDSLRLLRQARQRIGLGLRVIDEGRTAEPGGISLPDQ